MGLLDPLIAKAVTREVTKQIDARFAALGKEIVALRADDDAAWAAYMKVLARLDVIEGTNGEPT